MIDARDRSEGYHRMTVLTDVGSRGVCWRFADGIDRVVTAHAVAGDVVVIKIRGCPAVGRVTVVAGITALEMTNVLTRGGDAVVATGAGAEYLQMIDACHRGERRGRVAVLANTGCRYVGEILARRAHTVVAACAVA